MRDCVSDLCWQQGGLQSLDHNSLATCKRKQVFGLKISLKLEPSPLGRPCSSQNYDSTTHKLSRVGVEKNLSSVSRICTQNLIKKFICVLWKVISRIFGHSNFFKSDFFCYFFRLRLYDTSIWLDSKCNDCMDSTSAGSSSGISPIRSNELKNI